MAGTKGGDIVINCSKQGWWNSLTKAVRQFQQNEMHDVVLNELDKFCEKQLVYAVVSNRLGAKNAHQFTGNLINSIVVILYDKANRMKCTYRAYDSNLPMMKPPIRKEMSAMTSRGTLRKYAIHFKPADWQGEIDSSYLPELATDGSYGQDDAKRFADSWSPTTGKDFEICVAYTSEYAEWVEQQRHTIGYMASQDAARRGLISIGFKQIA
jgi:uncharacterized protein YdiU (UPF0061 family)